MEAPSSVDSPLRSARPSNGFDELCAGLEDASLLRVDDDGHPLIFGPSYEWTLRATHNRTGAVYGALRPVHFFFVGVVVQPPPRRNLAREDSAGAGAPAREWRYSFW